MGLLGGLFGGSTTYVSSTLYNLSGEPLERPSFLKTSVVGALVVPGGNSFGKNIVNSYLVGPGLRLRSFFNWADNGNYDGIGIPTGSLGGNSSVDAATVQGEIPADVDETIEVLATAMGIADYSNWVEQYIAVNNPSELGTAYISDINESTGEITITYVDTSTASFTPSDYDPNGVYIYATYNIETDMTPDPPVITGPFVFIYKFGTGNTTLDALIIAEADDGEYIPYIPIRLDGEFLSDTYEASSYALAKKAYKKVSRGNLDDVIASLNDNPDLDEIDYAYIVFGVPMNVLNKHCRKYLFEFFDRLRGIQTNTNVEWLLWQAAMDASEIVTAPENSVHIKSNGVLDTNINMKITWNTINYETGTGLGKVGATDDEYWLEASTVTYQDNVVEIFHQIDSNNWEKLIVIGAVHTNLVYNNKSVVITATEALDDVDESGFLVPLHYDTLYDMGIKDSTEVCSQSMFMVLNSYTVVKKKWYQTGIFKIIVFAAIIAISIAVPPLGGAAMATYASIGAAIGLTGILGAIVGAIVYSIATMIVMKVIGKISTELFGERFGQIIGAVLGVVAMTIGPAVLQGGSMSSAWGQMMSATNLLNMTNALAGGISGYVAAGAMKTMQETEELKRQYQQDYAELAQKFADEFGYGKAFVDPLGLTGNQFGNWSETEAQFLSRTLMTGTDIAELSKDMLNNFVEYTLTLDPSQGTGG